MPFQKMTAGKYPPRLWGLRGPAGSGKSTLATQMQGPLLCIDADGRFSEVLALTPDPVFELGGDAGSSTDADAIAEILEREMPGAEIGTIVIDSLTAILQPEIVRAMRAKALGQVKNLYAQWAGKALLMRRLQDAVTRWGCDTLWIWHTHQARDAAGHELTRASLPETEAARLLRSLNLLLEVVQDGAGKRGIRVIWARCGRSGQVLWDDSGRWARMPERIEGACYDGLTEADQTRLETEALATFADPAAAVAWAIERGAFTEAVHGKNAYAKVKREGTPTSAKEMARLWAADVARRLELPASRSATESGD